MSCVGLSERCSTAFVTTSSPSSKRARTESLNLDAEHSVKHNKKVMPAHSTMTAAMPVIQVAPAPDHSECQKRFTQLERKIEQVCAANRSLLREECDAFEKDCDTRVQKTVNDLTFRMQKLDVGQGESADVILQLTNKQINMQERILSLEQEIDALKLRQAEETARFLESPAITELSPAGEGKKRRVKKPLVPLTIPGPHEHYMTTPSEISGSGRHGHHPDKRKYWRILCCLTTCWCCLCCI